MSAEERELMARISALAGQINRHKNQQAGIQPSQSARGYRHNATSYRGRGYRVGRPTAVHRHRTLHLNAQPGSAESSPSTPDGGADTAQWVSKTDRHKQLINANIYHQQAQSRAQAIEETRQRKLTEQKSSERLRFNRFIQSRNGSSNARHGSPSNITICGIRFLVRDGGKKLVRASDESGEMPPTPKTTIVAGVRFHRTKTGNLVANRVIKDYRRCGAVKKADERCKIFSTTGSCPKGPRCRYQHDPDKVAMCKDFLKEGKCMNGKSCDLSHEVTAQRVANCLHFAKGNCVNQDCQYSHSAALPSAPVCESFGYWGYCEKGAECTERHVFECPAFSNTGTCKTKGCKLLHRERASVLRDQARHELDDSMEDVSSEDTGMDSDDVDSEDIAELVEAAEDDSDSELGEDFIRL